MGRRVLSLAKEILGIPLPVAMSLSIFVSLYHTCAGLWGSGFMYSARLLSRISVWDAEDRLILILLAGGGGLDLIAGVRMVVVVGYCRAGYTKKWGISLSWIRAPARKSVKQLAEVNLQSNPCLVLEYENIPRVTCPLISVGGFCFWVEIIWYGTRVLSLLCLGSVFWGCRCRFCSVSHLERNCHPKIPWFGMPEDGSYGWGLT